LNIWGKKLEVVRVAAAKPIIEISKSGGVTTCPSRGKNISILASPELILKLCHALI
jgi:hypothetical protein